MQSVSLGIQHSLKNHEGKGVQIVGEARPARWKLKEAASVSGLRRAIPPVTFWNRQVREGPAAQRGREAQRDLAGLLSHLFRPAPEAPGDLQSTLLR
jgi:hypothetical protein